MGEHRLPAGRACIEWLSDLGSALGYSVELEWPIRDPAGVSYVDVAWRASPDSRDALFLFEVESRASSGIAENAGKVLTVPTEHLVKPVFFFHVVLRGAGGRAARAARAHATANYGMYLFDVPDDLQSFASELLRQHARLRTGLDPAGLWVTLTSDNAPDGLSVARCVDGAQALFPRVQWTLALVRLAVHDEAARHQVAKELWARCWAPSETWSETWVGYLGERPLELAVLAALVPERGADCLSQLKAWQQLDPPAGRRAIGPSLGLSYEYDQWVLGYAPPVWILVALLMRDVDGASAWALAQVTHIFESKRLRDPFWFPAAAWALVGLRALGLDVEFDRVLQVANDFGGLPAADVAKPPVGFPDDDAAYTGDLATEPSVVRPGAVDAALAVSSDEPDLVGLALFLLGFETDMESVAVTLVQGLATVQAQGEASWAPMLFEFGSPATAGD